MGLAHGSGINLAAGTSWTSPTALNTSRTNGMAGSATIFMRRTFWGVWSEHNPGVKTALAEVQGASQSSGENVSRRLVRRSHSEDRSCNGDDRWRRWRQAHHRGHHQHGEQVGRESVKVIVPGMELWFVPEYQPSGSSTDARLKTRAVLKEYLKDRP